MSLRSWASRTARHGRPALRRALLDVGRGHPVEVSPAARDGARSQKILGQLPAERTLPPSAIATSQKSRCTSSPIALTRTPFPREHHTGEPWTKRHRRIRARDASRPAAGRPPKPRVLTPIVESGLPTYAFSRRPRIPCPDPDGALRMHFHAPNWNLVGEGEGVSHG